jgi:hypothetical protein
MDLNIGLPESVQLVHGYCTLTWCLTIPITTCQYDRCFYLMQPHFPMNEFQISDKKWLPFASPYSLNLT